MRILGISETCDLGSMYMRLLDEGHEVRVSVSEPLAQGTMAGLVPRIEGWGAELDWIREAGSDGLILFEAVGFGELQDRLRADGFQVIGGSAFGDRLENDRRFALELLGSRGLPIAGVREFASALEAVEDLQARPRRCVFKKCRSAGDTFVGTDPAGRDVAALLGTLAGDDERFIVMDHVEGVETGVGAYFNGERFLAPPCVDWEHKRFFPGDTGELTGEMGTVATFEHSQRIFESTLALIEPDLREAGHVGYINLNTIINADGIWPIEFTCRFGYPGFAVLEPLQDLGWGELFHAMLRRAPDRFPVRSGFSLAVVLTTPPFPYSRHELAVPVGLPVLLAEADRSSVHLGEVGLSGSQLVTTGVYGWTAVVTGSGATISEAQVGAYAAAAQVHAPDMRYRHDIGDSLASTRLEQLRSWGWL